METSNMSSGQQLSYTVKKIQCFGKTKEKKKCNGFLQSRRKDTGSLPPGARQCTLGMQLIKSLRPHVIHKVQSLAVY